MHRRIGLRYFTTKGHPRRFDRPSKPIKFPLRLELKDRDEGSDTASMSSYSVLSDDTDDGTSRSPPPRIERLMVAEETAFFNDLYDVISESFDRWDSELKTKGRDLTEMESEDRYIDLPVFFEKDVLMGKKPDGTGFWTGGLRLRGRTELHRLITSPGETVFGFEFGWIDDFSCRTYAILLIGNDKNVYYYDEDGDVEEAEDGDWSYYANGRYDLRKFGTAHVLDPFPPHRISDILTDDGGDLISL